MTLACCESGESLFVLPKPYRFCSSLRGNVYTMYWYVAAAAAAAVSVDSKLILKLISVPNVKLFDSRIIPHFVVCFRFLQQAHYLQIYLTEPEVGD